MLKEFLIFYVESFSHLDSLKVQAERLNNSVTLSLIVHSIELNIDNSLKHIMFKFVILLWRLTSDIKVKIFIIYIKWIIIALDIFMNHINFFIINLYNWRILCLMLLVTLFILFILRLRLIHQIITQIRDF